MNPFWPLTLVCWLGGHAVPWFLIANPDYRPPRDGQKRYYICRRCKREIVFQ